MKKKIKLVVSDIDGVLTDGKVIVFTPYDGKYAKTLCFKDLDAVGMLREQNVDICFITGEDDSFVDFVEEKFNPKCCIRGCKDKKTALQQLANRVSLEIEEILYIGDGKYDIPAIELASIGVCPSDSITEVKEAADIVLDVAGGCGCIAGVCSILKEHNKEFI